jgi:hypothetical protein
MTQADTDALRALGLEDVEILDITLTAAMRCFASKTFDALGAGPDAVYDGLEHQLSDLLPGRAKLGGRPMRAWRCGTEFRWGDAKGRLKNEDPSRGFRHQNK